MTILPWQNPKLGNSWWILRTRI